MNSDDIDRLLADVKLLLDNEDLGKAFYERLTERSGIQLIDFADFGNNSFHVVTELTCKNGDDEFRPDITLLINGLPLAFIEVKKPNNREGVLAERNRIIMGLTSWDGAPKGKVHKYDVAIAKNHLSGFELAQMQRIVSAYLDMAELQAMRRIPMTMADWEARLGGFLILWDRDVLRDAGKVTAEIAQAHAESEFEKYRIVQDQLFESDFDRMVKQLGSDGSATDGKE